MKRILAVTIAVFCFIIGSAQKIEFKKENIYLNSKKIDVYECKEKEFTNHLGEPDLREVKTFRELLYYKKGLEFKLDSRGDYLEYVFIYFKPFEKFDAFAGELWISGHRITGSTTVEELKKMKGLKITEEPTEINKYNDYKVEAEDMIFEFLYNRDGSKIEWIDINI